MKKTDDLNTPLHIACQNGDMNTVNLFIHNNADINSKK